MSKRCPTCGHILHGGREHIWDRERVIEAIQSWARDQGEPPSDRQWRKTITQGRSPDVPKSRTVKQLFGTWSAAVKAAGFEPRFQISSPYGGGLREAAIELGNQGFGPLYIAEVLQIKVDTVRYWLRKAGLGNGHRGRPRKGTYAVAKVGA